MFTHPRKLCSCRKRTCTGKVSPPRRWHSKNLSVREQKQQSLAQIRYQTAQKPLGLGACQVGAGIFGSPVASCFLEESCSAPRSAGTRRQHMHNKGAKLTVKSSLVLCLLWLLQSRGCFPLCILKMCPVFDGSSFFLLDP